MTQLIIRPMEPGEEAKVCNLVTEVFMEFVAPLYGQEGVEEFLSYLTVPALAGRVAEESFVLVARDGERLVGMTEVREHSHMSLLFTRTAMQRQGVGRMLLKSALDKCLAHDPALSGLTVNASPNAVPFYEKAGFAATGDSTTHNGITFTPMALAISQGRHHN